MGYIKQNFVSGQTLRADHLNHIEDGIVSISEAGCDWDLMENKPFGETKDGTIETIDPKYLPDDYINELIDAKLEVVENGTY